VPEVVRSPHISNNARIIEEAKLKEHRMRSMKVYSTVKSVRGNTGLVIQ
jgi:hypothetical protein